MPTDVLFAIERRRGAKKLESQTMQTLLLLPIVMCLVSIARPTGRRIPKRH